jgi:hypothetical protein
MARLAGAFAGEDGAALNGVADLDRRAAHVEPGANERDQAVELRGLQRERWHPGVRHADGNRVLDVLVDIGRRNWPRRS